MIYIVTGLSGSGKTTIAKKLSSKYHIPYLNIDEISDAKFERLKSTSKYIDATKEERITLFGEISTDVAVDTITKNIHKSFVTDSTCFLYESIYEFLKKLLNNSRVECKLILVETDVNEIIERRTKREIKRKEDKLKRKLTAEEVEKKYGNTRRIMKMMLPLLRKFKMQMKGMFEVVRN